MNLLITGAYNYSESQLEKIRALGLNVYYVQDERIALAKQDIDFEVSEIDLLICNGLFLYNDIREFRKLKWIHVLSAGLDRLPLEYIREKGIELYNATDVYNIPMAEWALLKVLEIYKQSRFFHENQSERKWLKNRQVREISGKNVSIIGFGNIGREVATRFRAFGAVINAVNIRKPESDYDYYYHIDDLKKAVMESDVIVLSLPLNKNTRHLFDKDVLDCMRKDAVLVNIARGQIINEDDLIAVLSENKLMSAALDVFENEPLDENSRLWELDNVIITPHNSFVSDKTNERLFDLVCHRLKKYLN